MIFTRSSMLDPVNGKPFSLIDRACMWVAEDPAPYVWQLLISKTFSHSAPAQHQLASKKHS